MDFTDSIAQFCLKSNYNLLDLDVLGGHKDRTQPPIDNVSKALNITSIPQARI